MCISITKGKMMNEINTCGSTAAKAPKQPELIEMLDKLSNIETRCSSINTSLTNVNARFSGDTPKEAFGEESAESEGAVGKISDLIKRINWQLDRIDREVSDLNNLV